MRTHGPLVLIDGHNCFIRNYVRSPYTDSNGERMGGTTGMIISVRKIVGDFKASNALVVWDGEGGSQKRRSIYQAYKAGRTVRLNEREGEEVTETPEQRMENMRLQMNLAQEYLTMLGIPQVRADGVEADDLIAYIAGKMDHEHGCIIVSTDQDMLQLIRSSNCRSCVNGKVEDGGCDGECGQDYCPHGGLNFVTCEFCQGTCKVPGASEVKVYSPVKKVMYDHQTFVSEYGVLPENFRFVKALTGDSSDNIEGIKGFGIKTIVKSFPFLLQRLSSADEVLSAGGALKGVLGKRLTEGKSRFLENLTLMDLSQPMLSATASRQARTALSIDMGCREVDFRMKIVKDAVSFGGTNFINPFLKFVIRRRRLMKEKASAGVEYFKEKLLRGLSVSHDVEGVWTASEVPTIDEDYIVPIRSDD